MPAHACVHTFHACKSLKSCKILRVSPLLHADLSCALLRLNTRGTLDMHHTCKLVTNARLVYPQTHVAHHTKSSTRTHVSLSNTRGTPDMHHSNDLVTSEWFCNDSWHTRINTSTMHTCAQKWSRAFSYINTFENGENEFGDEAEGDNLAFTWSHNIGNSLQVTGRKL